MVWKDITVNMNLLCVECYSIIPAKRLKAVPDTELCINCQSKNDVYVKRFDDSTKDGEVQVSSFFFKNTYLETAIKQFHGSTPYDSMGYQTPDNIKPIVYTGPDSIFSGE